MKDYDKHIQTLDGAIAQAKAQLSFNAGDGKSLHNRGESIKHMAKIVSRSQPREALRKLPSKHRPAPCAPRS